MCRWSRRRASSSTAARCPTRPPTARCARARSAATLGGLVAAAQTSLPAVGVLVLQPVLVDTAELDPMDPCDRSACDEGTVDDVTAFEDWRIGDAVRLLWYVWPSEWRSMLAPDAQLRNALAWTIFQAEAALPSDDFLPWEPWGAAVAMVRLDASRLPAWLDRASVVRQGGRARDARLQRAGTATRREQPAALAVAGADRAVRRAGRRGGRSVARRPASWPRASAASCRRSDCCRGTPSIPSRAAAISSPPALTSTPRRCRSSSSTSQCAATPRWRR